MNEYVYEITKDLDEDYYMDFLKSHKKRVSSEGEEDYEIICM